MPFKKEFVWGTATAAYQIEGAPLADGKGASIWDTFSHRPGRIKDGSDGDVACGSYEFLDEDIKLAADLGADAYRFSTAWTRIIPEGTGSVNRRGIDYYNRLIDGLLDRNVRPYLTMYHWDLPQALQEKGGFLNPDFPEWFRAYAETLVREFGDRVKHFFTFNEPQCIFGLGMDSAVHAPGLSLSKKEQLSAVHHMLLAHGLAVREVRKIPGAKAGYASCGGVPVPAAEKEADYRAAYEKFFELDENCPLGSVSLYADPIFFGRYPEEYYRRYQEIMPKIGERDMKIISSPVDFFAQNTYDGYFVGECGGKAKILPYAVGAPTTPMGWHIVPESLYYATKFLYERYKKPVYISENGISLQDFIFDDGKVHDPTRTEFIKRYIRQLERSAEEGTEIDGYFYWSLLDNFEWSEGYTQRFGLVYTDCKTLRRVPKDSYYEFRELIKKYKGTCPQK